MISLPRPIALQDLVGPASDRLARDLALLGGPGGQPAVPIVGDGSVAISGLSSSSEAAAGALCFAVRREFLDEARGRGAAAVIVGPALLEEAGPGWAGPALVVFSEPRLLFSVILGLQGEAFSPPWAAAEPFFKDRGSCDIGPGVVFGPFSYVGAGVSVGQGTRVGPRVFLDDGVSLGRDCVIHPGAVLRFGVRVGDRCQIHSNAVVGEDGF
ncbi:MAG: hypothetical protein LBL95_08300, partial [Deltaproteobacteria bacterium]|nr:hypothetical protein [Deltaproteobacteria bacterium]